MEAIKFSAVGQRSKISINYTVYDEIIVVKVKTRLYLEYNWTTYVWQTDFLTSTLGKYLNSD